MQAHLLVDEASLSKIRKLVRADLVKVGTRPSAVFDCLVALTEACTDALNRSPGQTSPPKITWVIDRNRAEICVEAFSPEGSAGGRTHSSLRQILEDEGFGGLGDDVVESLMDEVEVNDTDVAHSVRMVKELR